MDFLVKDSDKGGYLNHRIFACSYEPYWQRVRHACRNKFTPFAECRASLARLEAYILRADRGDLHETALRRWRVLNLLRAMPLGTTTIYGISKIPRAEGRLIKEYRDKITAELEEDGYPSEWDWAITRRNCIELWQSPDGAKFLDMLWRHLRSERATKGKKPEMHYFLNIIEETNDTE